MLCILRWSDLVKWFHFGYHISHLILQSICLQWDSCIVGQAIGGKMEKSRRPEATSMGWSPKANKLEWRSILNSLRRQRRPILNSLPPPPPETNPIGWTQEVKRSTRMGLGCRAPSWGGGWRPETFAQPWI